MIVPWRAAARHLRLTARAMVRVLFPSLLAGRPCFCKVICQGDLQQGRAGHRDKSAPLAPPAGPATGMTSPQGAPVSTAMFWEEWCRRRDSNPRPQHYECRALPAELLRHPRRCISANRSSQDAFRARSDLWWRQGEGSPDPCKRHRIAAAFAPRRITGPGTARKRPQRFLPAAGTSSGGSTSGRTGRTSPRIAACGGRAGSGAGSGSGAGAGSGSVTVIAGSAPLP